MKPLHCLNLEELISVIVKNELVPSSSDLSNKIVCAKYIREFIDACGYQITNVFFDSGEIIFPKNETPTVAASAASPPAAADYSQPSSSFTVSLDEIQDILSSDETK